MPLHDFALGWGVCPPRLNALLMGGMHTRASSSQRPGFASPSPLTPVLSEAGLCLALSPHPSLIGGRALPRPLPSPQPYRRPGFASPSPLTPVLSEAGLCLADEACHRLGGSGGVLTVASAVDAPTLAKRFKGATGQRGQPLLEYEFQA
jgi:hypothetical protein